MSEPIDAEAYLAQMVKLGDVELAGTDASGEQQYRLTERGMKRAHDLLVAAGIVVQPFHSTDEMMMGVLDHLAGEGGRLTIAFRQGEVDTPPDDRWIVGYEFGREAEDSDMAGGASYGMGANLNQALRQVFDEVGAKVPDE
jgi:hypothetical protein